MQGHPATIFLSLSFSWFGPEGNPNPKVLSKVGQIEPQDFGQNPEKGIHESYPIKLLLS